MSGRGASGRSAGWSSWCCSRAPGRSAIAGTRPAPTRARSPPRRPGRRPRRSARRRLDMPQAVGIAAVTTGDMPVVLQGLGTVTPLATVTVQSQISGYLTQVKFREGQTVKAGDVLAQIDSRPYEALLAQYQGQLARDQALLQNAQARPAALPDPEPAGLDLEAERRHPGRPGEAERGHGRGRSGAGRPAEAQHRLHAHHRPRSRAGSACGRSIRATTSRPPPRRSWW